jgi:hypothetical protein
MRGCGARSNALFLFAKPANPMRRKPPAMRWRLMRPLRGVTPRRHLQVKPWNYRPAEALWFMPNDLSRTGQQQVAGVSPELDATAKTTRRKWRERLQRDLLKIWLASSALWIGCIVAILGQCVYGRWFDWQLSQCEGPLVNPVETYVADFATAFGPPAAVLLSYRVVTGVSRRLRRRR